VKAVADGRKERLEREIRNFTAAIAASGHDLDGKLLGEIPNLGRTYSLKLGANGTLWASMQQLSESPGSPGWIVKLDRKSGKILGYVPVSEKAGLHSVEDAGEGQPMTDVGNRVFWFERRSLGSVQ